MIDPETISFWNVSIGNLLTSFIVLIALITYRMDNRKNNEERAEARQEMERRQNERHAENQRRLELLVHFQETQVEINRKRDEQIAALWASTSEIKVQTATIIEVAKGLDRRVRIMEDKH